MYMFSGTFFALSQLPHGISVIAQALPLAQGVDLCRSLSLGTASLPAVIGHTAYLLASSASELRSPGSPTEGGCTHDRHGLDSAPDQQPRRAQRADLPALTDARALSILEPILYLLSIGFGVGALVGRVHGVDVRYAAFVAPAILATTAMNAAFNQTSFGIFLRIKHDRIYDAIVPTPLSIPDIALGEVASAVFSGIVRPPGSSS